MSEIKNDRLGHYGDAKHSKYNDITTLGFKGLIKLFTLLAVFGLVNKDLQCDLALGARARDDER